MTNPLQLPIQQDDVANVDTLGGYLAELLVTLLTEEEGFSGKRPLGNSDWLGPIEDALVPGYNDDASETTTEAALMNLDERLRTQWASLKDAIAEALTAREAEFEPVVALRPVTGNQVRVTIETTHGIKTTVFEPHAERSTGKPTRSFAEYIGHTVGNVLTFLWGPFGPDPEPEPDADPALQAVAVRIDAARRIHEANVADSASWGFPAEQHGPGTVEEPAA